MMMMMTSWQFQVRVSISVGVDLNYSMLVVNTGGKRGQFIILAPTIMSSTCASSHRPPM